MTASLPNVPPPSPVKRCRQCGEVKPLEQFRRNQRVAYAYATDDPKGYRPRCAECEVGNRTEPKNDRRERHKARDTRARHARRLGIPIDRLERFYGWNLDQIEAAIVDVARNGCPDCHHPVLGLSDIHIDIDQPECQPFWPENVRVICATCNKRKGRQSRVEMACAEAERRAIVRLAGPPLIGEQLTMFDVPGAGDG